MTGDWVPWVGFSPGLKTQADLLAKLRRDLARLEADPNDDDAAWDFFVTADHMRDWERSRGLPPRRVTDDPLLGIVWDLASHGKHFSTYPKVATVDEVRRAGTFKADAFDPNAFATERLVVGLEGSTLGPSISAVKLARRVVAWWKGALN